MAEVKCEHCKQKIRRYYFKIPTRLEDTIIVCNRCLRKYYMHYVDEEKMECVVQNVEKKQK